MADHRGALRAAGPVAAGFVLARREGAAVNLRASQNVVSVRYVVDTGDHSARPATNPPPAPAQAPDAPAVPSGRGGILLRLLLAERLTFSDIQFARRQKSI